MNSSYQFLTACIMIASTWGFVTRWEVGRYGHCSVSCGRGVQTRPVTCKGISPANNLPEELCPFPKPPSIKSCAVIACTPEWFVQGWQECSKTCGRGFQLRELHCSQRLADGMVTSVSEDYCPRGRPLKRRRCGISDCPPRYSAKKWTTCSTSCGGGVQFRPVHCTRIKAGAHASQVIATDYCSHLVPPHRKRRCIQNECPGAVNVVQNGRRTVKFRNRDLETYFRKRRTYRIRSPVNVRQGPQPHLSGLTDLQRTGRQSSILDRKKVSRRRRITAEKNVHHDCENIFGNGLNTSDAESYVPCLLRYHDSNPAHQDYDTVLPHLNGPERLSTTGYSRPYIVTRTDISPSLFPPAVVHVGGILTISHTDTITLLCEATGHPSPITQWLKDGNQVVESERLAISRENSQRESSLRFIRPIRSDSGVYTCNARNALGKSFVDTTLNVVTKPKIHLLETNDVELKSSVHTPIGSVIRAQSGAVIRISCPVTGFPPPRIRWDKDVTGLGENARILPDDSLEIYPATPTDQGLYSCEATNPVGTDYRASTLLLFEPPHLQEFLSLADTPEPTRMGLPRLLLAKEGTPIYTLDPNGSAIIGCSVANEGELEVTWAYANTPIDRSGIRFHTLVDGMVLLIEIVDAKSAGVYSCHSRNAAGDLTASLEIQLAKYSFIPGPLTECTHSCGGSGTQYVSLNCVRDGKKAVPEWYCTGIRKPKIQAQACNRIDCQPSFHVEPWSPCSKTCGLGKRSRKVTCFVLRADDKFREISTSVCAKQLSPGSELDVDLTTNSLPTNEESCFLSACPLWRIGSWSPCGEKCYGLGVGMRVRRLYCINANGTSVSRMECSPASRPKWRELCFTKRCDPVWIVSKWSSCSRTCGDAGIQTRILNCVFRGNIRQRARNLCDDALRPRVTMPCGRIPC